mmetsp:Transcript_26201/g.86059  ORF Transcript_26201/g.86059 Transcript_26201/m.86059 type:complete len:354 (-) Transcript_26201:40-1101(-)
MRRTPVLVEYIPFQDMHHLHSFAGAIVGVEVVSHSLCHTLRWARQGNLHFLYTHVTGRSGVVSLLCTPLIVWPMFLPALKRRMRWELRKGLHYLSIVWGIAIAFHAPAMHIRYTIGIPVALYIADLAWGFFRTTHLISSSVFVRLNKCVELAFENPSGFHTNGTGYVYICLPWISKSEWHAFSMFKHPTLPNHSCVCMAVVGDWTRRVHDALKRPTVRPTWVNGPYASPYGASINYDSLITVASGIGITPAISIITTHQLLLVLLILLVFFRERLPVVRIPLSRPGVPQPVERAALLACGTIYQSHVVVAPVACARKAHHERFETHKDQTMRPQLEKNVIRPWSEIALVFFFH